MLDPSLLAICLREGHLVSWRSGITAADLLPGSYMCYRCLSIVEILASKPDSLTGSVEMTEQRSFRCMYCNVLVVDEYQYHVEDWTFACEKCLDKFFPLGAGAEAVGVEVGSQGMT